jgi:hypothetical protein
MYDNSTLIKLLRSISLTFVIAFGLITIVATGGGNGGNDGQPTDPGTAPEISNLNYEICPG